MITVELRNKDARLICDALRQMRNESRSVARSYSGVTKTHKKMLMRNVKRCDALRSLLEV